MKSDGQGQKQRYKSSYKMKRMDIMLVSNAQNRGGKLNLHTIEN